MYLNHKRGCRVFVGPIVEFKLKKASVLPTLSAITICRFFARILFVQLLQVIYIIKRDKCTHETITAIIGLVISYFITSYMSSPREGNVL